MTPDERINAAWANLFDNCQPSEELRRLWGDTINAAVEEDRKTRPHVFVGAHDRWCEVCNEPDRDERHLPSREILRNSVAFAVEEEREACAKIIEDSYDAFTDTALPFAGPALLKAAKDIRARSNKAA